MNSLYPSLSNALRNTSATSRPSFARSTSRSPWLTLVLRPRPGRADAPEGVRAIGVAPRSRLLALPPLAVRAKNALLGSSASSRTLLGAHASPSPRSSERPFVPERCPALGRARPLALSSIALSVSGMEMGIGPGESEADGGTMGSGTGTGARRASAKRAHAETSPKSTVNQGMDATRRTVCVRGGEGLVG